MPIPDVVGEQQAKRRKKVRRRNPKKVTGRAVPGRARRVQRAVGRQQTQQRRTFRTKPWVGQGPGTGRVRAKTAGGKPVYVSKARYQKASKKFRKAEKARKAYAASLGYKSLKSYNVAKAAKPYKDSDVKIAGVNVSDTGSGLERKLFAGNNLRVVTAPYQIARATVEDPKKVLPATAKGARDIIVGLPSAAVKSVTDPKGAVKELTKDYSRRYGPLAQGDTRGFRERIKKEGAAPEVLDIAGAAAIEGRILGAGLKGAKHPLMAQNRPRLKVSGGKSRTQTTSPNAFKAAGQRGVDTARQKVSARRQARERAPALDVSLKPGEVAPIRRGRKQVRSVARRKSRGVQAMKGEQARVVHRGASRNIAKLSKDESRGFKYAMQLGIRDPATATATLTKRRADIVKAREVEGTEIPKALAKTNDELRVIDRILEDPEAVFTPRLTEVADVEAKRSKQVAAGDPGLNARQAILRRYAPQAEHLGEGRGVKRVEVHDPKATAKAMRRHIKKRTGIDPAIRVKQAKERVRKAEEAGTEAARMVAEERLHVEGGQALRRDLASQGKEVPAVLQSRLIEAAERLERKQTHNLEASAGLQAARRDVKRAEAEMAPPARARTRERAESASEYVKRVKAKAKEEGLAEPAYFKSSKRPTVRFSNFALGGTRAVAEDKAYTGALFRTGREDVRPQVHTDALAANIKRKHNWNTVADNFEAHAFQWGKNKPLSALLDELDRRGIDPGDVAFWNPRKYRESRKNLGDVDETPFGEDISPPGLAQAVDDAATDFRGLATKGEDFKNTSGWSVIPKKVYDEIHADTRPSHAALRAWDVAKAKQSRILLGTNPPWLAFQVGSNALLTGLAKTGPIDAVKAQVWWRRLDPKLKEAVEPYVGVGPFRVDVAQPKLGASTNNRLVNGYRAFKDTPLMRRAGKANPLDLLFRADNAQNNFFRRSVLYSQAKRDAYQRLGRNTSLAAQAEGRLQGLFTLGPQDQIRAVLRNQESIERHAQYVNDMLGDYATYTAKERRILGRSVMFYGFLRYSLNFTFHTMPTQHPAMTALIGNLARLQTEEVRRILGGDELPFALGRIYIKKDGQLQVVDLARLNPASNVVVEAASAKDIAKPVGMFPPIVAAALDIAYGKSAFKGKGLRVKGETGYGAFERELTGQRIGAGDAGRVALERLLTLAYPYRAAKKVVTRGEPQGDDSLLFDLRPTKYKRPDIVKSIRKRKADTSQGQILREQVFPFLPKPTTDPAFAESIREARGKGKPKKKGKKKVRPANPYRGSGGGSSSANPY